MTTYLRLEGTRVVGVYEQDDAGGIPAPVVDAHSPDHWPPRPSAAHELHLVDAVITWLDPRGLDELRAAKWEEVKAARAQRMAGSFDALGHTFDVDLQKLPGAALDAFMAQQLGEAYSQPWVLADNSVIALNAAQQIAVARACKAYVAGLWATSVQLRAAIDAAADAEAIAAITWPEP